MGATPLGKAIQTDGWAVGLPSLRDMGPPPRPEAPSSHGVGVLATRGAAKAQHIRRGAAEAPLDNAPGGPRVLTARERPVSDPLRPWTPRRLPTRPLAIPDRYHPAGVWGAVCLDVQGEPRRVPKMVSAVSPTCSAALHPAPPSDVSPQRASSHAGASPAGARSARDGLENASVVLEPLVRVDE